MHKILRTYGLATASSVVFAIAVGAWTAPYLVAAIEGPQPLGQLHAILPAALPSQVPTAGTSDGMSGMDGMMEMPDMPPDAPPAAAGSDTPSAQATPSADGTTHPISATATTSSGPIAPSADTTAAAPEQSPTSTPSPIAAPTLSAAVQIAMQTALEQQGKLFLEALQASDVSAVRSMLAARCQSADVPALIATRQAAISAQAGVPIADITPLTTYVGHFDPAAGEAHTVLEWVANGQRMTLLSADGWLYEGGQWKDASC